VNTALGLCNNGDILVIPAGTETWASTLAVGKAITIQGNGTGNTVITGNLTYSMPVSNTYTLFRLTNLTLIGFLTLNNAGAGNAGRFRVDHSILTSTSSMIRVNYPAGTGYRDCWGVFDNNAINIGASMALYGGNANTWTEVTHVYGTDKMIFFEDNIITHTGGVGELFVGAGCGVNYCWRYNDLRYNESGTHGYIWDMHGNQGVGSNHGSMSAECYGNDISASIATNCSKVMDQRGGSALVFWNKVTSGFANQVDMQLEEENDDCSYGHVPCVGPDGQTMHVSKSYYWNNRKATDALVTTYNIINDDTYHIALGTDFWTDNGGGVTDGVIGDLPATCAVGDAYWATDQNTATVSADNIGVSPVAPIAGKLYVCLATNVWTQYYTPYTYPHPLRDENTYVRIY
jgi:hypothetical protein